MVPHSLSIPQICQNEAQLDTSPAELQETDPFAAAVLFTGFQGSSLPSLENQYAAHHHGWKLSFEIQ